ncbi:methylisocitrate lyase [Fredinandcohnia quinoae]|uniref:Methylisocitrate lyase n=1 Tax=Fredinandcohnia quinoae TaxID=2918902 RepID=A0AAW5EA04_9BACI|nr:methylisocitrate lyase [Fredinandcohnia sp. SECRCQ15]MCH1626832.1 methylisocitrate lyase [Fredinandcohnia sp. SECRCQ15]
MPWIIDKEHSQEELAKQFRIKMMDSTILQIPGAYDGMSALLAKKAGFEALYLSGAAYTASRGLPDLGINTSEEIATRAKDLIRATNLPVLVDIDTGFGGVLNTARTAREMVESKVAAVQIEDQELPKKCGHLNGKKLVRCEDMMQKIRIIKEVAPTLLVIARTDALAIEGMDGVIERANKYIEAGADAIFPEALTTEDEFLRVKNEVNAPLLANMTEFGKTPYYRASEFELFGYSMVIYPVTSLRVAAKAIEDVLNEIHQAGTQKNSLDKMQTRKELYETIHYFDFEKLDSEISKTILS